MRIIKTVGLILAFVLLLPNSLAQGQKPELYIKSGRSGLINSIDFSADGEMIVSGGDDGTIKFWDVNSGSELRTISSGVSVTSVAFFPNKNVIVSTGNGLRFWDIVDGKELQKMDSIASLVIFSEDGKQFAVTEYDKISVSYLGKEGMFTLVRTRWSN